MEKPGRLTVSWV